MSRRRTPYKAPYDRRELTIAIVTAVAIVLVTAVLVWVLRPNKDLGADQTRFPEPTSTAGPTATTVPVSTGPAATGTTAP